MAHENIKWTETLPAVLLGLRVAVKPDINASSAELVYGVSLRLPAEICTDTSSMPLDYGFVQQLKNHMNHLKPLSTSTHGFSKHTLQGKRFIAKLLLLIRKEKEFKAALKSVA
ncbi:hypothetical protein TNCV_667001 [Trichonephila clavipes]|nr:hypothetical protein TNCV_667001 [Trichonephila clavipes]